MTTKVYIGHSDLAGESGIVSISKGGRKRRLAGGPFAWGALAKTRPEAAALAKALLTELLGDKSLAERFHRRFLWRAIVNWPRDFAFTADELQAIVSAIQQTEAGTAESRTMAAQTPAPVVAEGGEGVEWERAGPVGVKRPGPKT